MRLFILGQLKELGNLLKEGILTQQEFAEQKQISLADLRNIQHSLANVTDATKTTCRGIGRASSAVRTAPGREKIAKYVPLVSSSISFLEPTFMSATTGLSLLT